MRHRSLEIEFSRRESRLIWSISQSFHRSSALFCPARCPSYKLSIYLLDAVRAIMLPYTSKYGWNLETLTLQPQWSQYGVCHNVAKVFLKSYHVCLFVSRVACPGPPFAWRTCLYLQKSPQSREFPLHHYSVLETWTKLYHNFECSITSIIQEILSRH